MLTHTMLHIAGCLNLSFSRAQQGRFERTACCVKMTGESSGSTVAGKRVVHKRSLDYSAIVSYSATEALESLKSSQMAKKLKEEEKSAGKEGGHHKGKKDAANNSSILWQPPSVVLSSRDKAAQLTLSKDHLACIGAKGGYRMIRSTHGVHSGRYYWEAQMLPPGSNVDGIFSSLTAVSDSNNNVASSKGSGAFAAAAASSSCPFKSGDGLGLFEAHVRVGWSTRQGELQAPVGFDKYSYGYRDARGSKIHDSVREDDYGEPYSYGDIIGCCISLNDQDPSENYISFYKNGVDQKKAYESIPPGVYFPAVSIYMGGVVSVNFGPSFVFKPPVASCTAVSELQPLNSDDRKGHMQRIGVMRDLHLQHTAAAGGGKACSNASGGFVNNV